MAKTVWTLEERNRQRQKMAEIRKSRWKRYSSDALSVAMATMPKLRSW